MVTCYLEFCFSQFGYGHVSEKFWFGYFLVNKMIGHSSVILISLLQAIRPFRPVSYINITNPPLTQTGWLLFFKLLCYHHSIYDKMYMQDVFLAHASSLFFWGLSWYLWCWKLIDLKRFLWGVQHILFQHNEKALIKRNSNQTKKSIFCALTRYKSCFFLWTQ